MIVEPDLTPPPAIPGAPARTGRSPLAEGPRPPRPAALTALLLVLAWGTAALPGLLDLPVRRAAQARVVGVARAMIDTGDLVVPRYNDEVRLKKPPLQSWLQAGAMAATGSREPWVAGLASWVAGILFALTPWWLGRALGREDAGILGSLLLCASRATTWWGASPEHDVPFAGWVGLSWVFVAHALSGAGRPRHSALAGLACGAALLVKGPFALAFVPGTAAVASFLARRREGSGRVRWTLLLAGAVLPPLAWLVAVAAGVGGVGAVFDEVRRQALGEANAHVPTGAAAFTWYLVAVPAWSMPWSVLGIPALAWALLARRGASPGPRPLDGMGFAAAAFGVGFVTLTVTPAKQAHYALPILPPLLLLSAAACLDLAARWRRAAAALPFAVAGLGVAFLASRAWGAAREGGVAVLPYVAIGVAASALPLLARIRGAGPRFPRVLTAACLAAVVAAGMASRLDGLRYRATDDWDTAVARMASPLDPTLPLVGYARGQREAFDTLAVRLDRSFGRVRDAEALRERLDSGQPFHLMALAVERDDLAPFSDRLELLATLAPARPESKRSRVLLYRAR